MANRSTTVRFDRFHGHRPPIAVETQRTEQRRRLGRAYRAGRLICGSVHVTISVDERLGLTQQERRRLRARFDEPLDDELRRELTQLVRRRGAAALRIADDLEAIEIALETPSGEHQCITCQLQPPQVRHRHLHDIEFVLGLKQTQ